MYENPDRCPGLRINHETYRALMANYGDIPTGFRFSDLAHVMVDPYVDAATFDHRCGTMLTSQPKKMVRFGARTDLRQRLHPNLAAIIETAGRLPGLSSDLREPGRYSLFIRLLSIFRL